MKEEYDFTNAIKKLNIQGHPDSIDTNRYELEKWKQGVNTALEDENYLAFIKDLGST